MKTLDYRARLIELAGEINAEMPQHVVSKIAAALNDDGRSIAGASILVLGVAYKADVDDARESPALDVISLVQQRGAHVAYADPHVPSVSTDAGDLESVPLTAELLARADCVVIATNHRVFDYDLVVRHARIVVDTRNALAHTRKGAARVVRL
jgi:UDP-N-acetyl-D-glucosamine dehydrogenase